MPINGYDALLFWAAVTVAILAIAALVFGFYRMIRAELEPQPEQRSSSMESRIARYGIMIGGPALALLLLTVLIRGAPDPSGRSPEDRALADVTSRLKAHEQSIERLTKAQADLAESLRRLPASGTDAIRPKPLPGYATVRKLAGWGLAAAGFIMLAAGIWLICPPSWRRLPGPRRKSRERVNG